MWIEAPEVQFLQVKFYVKMCLFQNTDVVRRCLDFINFLCLHLRVASKSLPADFLDSVWTLLIDVLRQDLSSMQLPVSLNGSVRNSSDGRLAAHNNETKSVEKTVAMVTSVFEMEEFERHVELLLSDLVKSYFLYFFIAILNLCKYSFCHACIASNVNVSVFVCAVI